MSVHLSCCLYVCLSVSQLVCLSVYLPVCMCVCLSVFLSVCLSLKIAFQSVLLYVEYLADPGEARGFSTITSMNNSFIHLVGDPL